MINACILTPWAGDGQSDTTAYHPALADAYALQAWTDAVGQHTANIPPTVNLYAIIAVLTPTVAAAIFADPKWTNAILWMDTYMPKGTAQTTSQFTALTNMLNGTTTPGVAPTVVTPAASVTPTPSPIGSAPNGQTNQQIAALAIAYLATLTK